jgi:predicted nucleotidyltransferase
MVTKESAIKTARSFVDDCEKAGLKFYKVLLFGSAARNELHAGSDVDLLLISDQFGDNVFENLKLYSRINIRYPVIETHPYPTDVFIHGNDFINDLLKDSVEIR